MVIEHPSSVCSVPGRDQPDSHLWGFPVMFSFWRALAFPLSPVFYDGAQTVSLHGGRPWPLVSTLASRVHTGCPSSEFQPRAALRTTPLFAIYPCEVLPVSLNVWSSHWPDVPMGPRLAYVIVAPPTPAP